MDGQFHMPSFSDWDWNNGNVLNRRRNEKKRRDSQVTEFTSNLSPQAISSSLFILWTCVGFAQCLFFFETLAYVCLPVCPFSFPDRELDQQVGLAWWAGIQHLSRWRMQPRFNEVSASWPWKRVSTCLVASSEQYFFKKINSKVWNWSWYSEVRITIMSLRTWPRTHQSNGRCTTFADDSSLLGKSLWVVSFCCF